VYAVDGSDPAEALRAAEVAPGALGFAELVAESQAFMTGHVGHAGWLGQFKVDGSSTRSRRKSACTAATMTVARMSAARGCPCRTRSGRVTGLASQG